ncbi:MAG: site-specific integrase [Nitrosopumilus sp.]|nr:site-specific integrase [Nitrosopumilus sp.]
MSKSISKIENYPLKRKIDQAYERAKTISPKNQELFKKYDRVMIQDTLAIATRVNQLEVFIRLSKMVRKDWVDVTKDDVDKLVYDIMTTYSPDGKENWATHDYKKVLTILMKWMYLGKRCTGTVKPDIISNVVIKKPKNKLIREELLTDDDISKIIKATINPRDRALLAVQAESGARPGEMMSLRIKHVKVDQYGAKIAVDGKTGARSVRIVKSVPELMNWIDIHPFKNNGESPLWVVLRQGSNYGEALDWSSAHAILADSVKKSGITKRVFLNLFRHSSATKSAQFMTESQLRMRQGWTPTSTMPATYVHMIGSDADNAYLEHMGIKTEKKNYETQTPQICTICKTPNSVESDICHRCGKPLDLEIATKLDERNQSELSEMIKEAVSQEMQRENHYLRNKIAELESRT